MKRTTRISEISKKPPNVILPSLPRGKKTSQVIFRCASDMSHLVQTDISLRLLLKLVVSQKYSSMLYLICLISQLAERSNARKSRVYIGIDISLVLSRYRPYTYWTYINSKADGKTISL